METKEIPDSMTHDNTKIIFACSGASDLGEITDQVARKLGKDGLYRMKCLAMVGAGDKELIKTINNSEAIVIDGCPVDCGKKIMEEAWLTNYQYIRLTDLGLVKGKTPATKEVIEQICNHIKNKANLQSIEQVKPVKRSCCG